MKLFSVLPGADSATAYLQNEDLTMEHVLAGLRLNAVRSFFKKHPQLEFQIVGPDGVSVLEASPEINLPDLMAWSWLFIFSVRARDLAVQLGCEESDFFSCRIDVDAAAEFFFHVPEQLNDVIDFKYSVFDVEPTERLPVPFGINKMAIRKGVRSSELKPCWRPMMASPDHMAGELMVREDFKEAWEASALTGASFRFMAECDSEH